MKQVWLSHKSFWTLAGMGILAVPLMIFGWLVFQRPPQTATEKQLFQGIDYRREYRSQPRPIMLHIVSIDLAAQGVKVLATPGQARTPEWETNARTTSEFLQEFKLQLAVNANFFYPFDENTPWNSYPNSGDRVGVVGQAISNGQEYSSPQESWAVFCITANQRARILASGRCPTGTTQAISGSGVIVENGQSIPAKQGAADSDGNYSRTAVAVDKTGQKLWLIAVDDKQWLYSEGVTLGELAETAIALGADAALNLDGGGSTTLVTSTPKGFQILNSPVHTKIPMRERPVANHLGFYALPTP
ncbi:MAG: phosphodiester glycosidase family protein [Oscillatoriales cyanobacterium C42_A2020_001]|nr:phosphodiester glycosidase family protein [Leptolyngbyaceae cyanobacterium C42_A2020_001]